jgi:hypothetical protein
MIKDQPFRRYYRSNVRRNPEWKNRLNEQTQLGTTFQQGLYPYHAGRDRHLFMQFLFFTALPRMRKISGSDLYSGLMLTVYSMRRSLPVR